MDYKSIQEPQTLLCGVAPVCGRDMRDVVCAWLWERQGQMAQACPPQSQQEHCHPLHMMEAAFGQKGACISTGLSQSASRNEKHWKNRQAGLWEPSPEGSRQLFVSQLLTEWSGWCVGLGSRWLQYSAPPFLRHGKAQECCFTGNQ